MRERERVCVCVGGGERGGKEERERKGRQNTYLISYIRQLRYSFSAGNIRKRF